jgi:hypothetical protein
MVGWDEKVAEVKRCEKKERLKRSKALIIKCPPAVHSSHAKLSNLSAADVEV